MIFLLTPQCKHIEFSTAMKTCEQIDGKSPHKRMDSLELHGAEVVFVTFFFLHRSLLSLTYLKHLIQTHQIQISEIYIFGLIRANLVLYLVAQVELLQTSTMDSVSIVSCNHQMISPTIHFPNKISIQYTLFVISLVTF